MGEQPWIVLGTYVEDSAPTLPKGVNHGSANEQQ